MKTKIFFDFDNTLYSGNVWTNWKDYIIKFLQENFEDSEEIIQKYNVNNYTSV